MVAQTVPVSRVRQDAAGPAEHTEQQAGDRDGRHRAERSGPVVQQQVGRDKHGDHQADGRPGAGRPAPSGFVPGVRAHARACPIARFGPRNGRA
ncbi:hypothetical protein [Streptomyces vietnamensis]|uniref:hypothetical protein n=1 Tax=Streptomyces vietnamensis TaxID=362257 RepID=UPI003449EE3D